jgi:hypothetical protein
MFSLDQKKRVKITSLREREETNLEKTGSRISLQIVAAKKIKDSTRIQRKALNLNKFAAVHKEK